jgi:serine/threonine-protein kinase
VGLNLVAGTVIADRFRLVRPLGQGGMGEVWLADHISLDIPCAIKFIFAETAKDEELRARFDREAKIAAQIRSPHVVQILDNGVFHGAPYIAMELLEGEDLAQRLERLGRLDPQATAAIVAQVARALTKAHAAGLVHRDLKPANIFLVRDDDREIAKVLDFGIAKSSTLNLGPGGLSATKTGSLLGTPVYMSPEQAQGTKTVDHRTDLWALGVVTFECLTGRLPFDSAALGDLFMKIMVEPLPVPSRIAPLPASFDAWWARAAARYPDQRFQSAKELVDGLNQAFGLTGDLGSISRVGPFSGAPFAPTVPQPYGPPSAPAHAPHATQPYGPASGPAQAPPPGQGFAPGAPQGAWPNAAGPGAVSPYGGPRPLTAGPVVAALTAHAAPAPRSAMLVPVIAALLSLVVIGGLALFFLTRPSPGPVAEGAGTDAPRGLPTASATSAPALPPASAAPIEVVPSASAPLALSAPASSVKPPPGKPATPGTSKPTTPIVKPKRPDFGI